MTFFLPQPKPTPYLLKQQKVRKDRDKIDREERAKVRARSGGRCEVLEVTAWSEDAAGVRRPKVSTRCLKRASENHHLLGGLGRRNRGRSILADHRLDVCPDCHKEITNHVLVPAVEEERRVLAAEVKYERVKARD